MPPLGSKVGNSIRLPGAKEDGGSWEQDVNANTGASSMMSLM